MALPFERVRGETQPHFTTMSKLTLEQATAWVDRNLPFDNENIGVSLDTCIQVILLFRKEIARLTESSPVPNDNWIPLTSANRPAPKFGQVLIKGELDHPRLAIYEDRQFYCPFQLAKSSDHSLARFHSLTHWKYLS